MTDTDLRSCGPGFVVPEVDLELLRQGLARCRWCGGTRPVDSWCTCLPVDEQLERVQAEACARRGELDAAERRAQLAAGRWTPAGSGLEVRLA